jgi:hypothetical protein
MEIGREVAISYTISEDVALVGILWDCRQRRIVGPRRGISIQRTARSCGFKTAPATPLPAQMIDYPFS